jgi:predicted RNA-binding Zn-ribbon protein involved in translation (DUF1610 family)
MNQLVEGIFECPKCKKIIREKREKVEEAEEKRRIVGELLDGEYIHNNFSINQKYEIVDSGILINKTDTRAFGALICHSAYVESEVYIRLSWWKKSFYRHAGMMKIHDKNVLKNLINALEKIDEKFDEFWAFKGKFREDETKTEEEMIKEKKLDLIKYRILENRTCPNCQNKMKKKKSYYECDSCGEIVIMEYNQPIFNIDPSDLKLNFQANFPINYYLPLSGITIKWLMAEWKALVVIYSKDNPNKKWLRFYWWVRDLKNVLKYGKMKMGEGSKLGWEAKKGSGTTNLYNKEFLQPLIKALKKLAKKLNWELEEN